MHPDPEAPAGTPEVHPPANATSDALLVRLPDGVRVRVNTVWRERLLEDGQWLSPSLLLHRTLLKQTASRRVELLELACGGAVVVKTYPLPWYRSLLAGGPHATEWRNACRLVGEGLPCALPLAVGERRVGALVREGFVVTEALRDGRDLSDLLRQDEPWDLERRYGVTRELGALFARLHRIGALLGDPHAGNFLVTPNGVVLVDLRRVRWGEPTKKRCHEHLLLVHQALGLYGTSTEPCRFLKSYSPDGWHALAKNLGEPARATVRAYHRRRAPTALGTNQRFERRVLAGTVWHLRRTEETAELNAFLADPATFVLDKEVLKTGRSSSVYATGEWVLKRVHQKRRRNRVLDRFRWGRVRRAMVMAFLLEISGIPTPRVLAAGVERTRGLVTGGWLVTRRVQNAQHVDRTLDAFQGASRTEVLVRLAKVLAKLHGLGLAHRDLKAGNVLIDAQGKIHLVDLDGIRPLRTVSARRRRRDLERLFRDLRARAALSPHEQAMFHGAYWGE